MAEILALRHEAAQIVGFANFAEYSLATKMARTPAEVTEFLQHLARVSRPAAEREFKELEQFAGRPLAAWDVAYYSERLKNERLQLSRKRCAVFPRAAGARRAVHGDQPAVRRTHRREPGCRGVSPDVRYFDVLDRDGTPRGGFFLDLYARPKKRGGAWMDECVGRIQLAGTSALPIAYLVCNFAPPAASSRRCSRTTTCSRCSTSSATVSTTCSRA